MTKEEKQIHTRSTALIALDYENDEYEMLEIPLTKRLHLKTEGSIRELEESGVILPDSIRAFHVAKDNIMEFFTGGIREPLGLHALLYILSADMTKYIPVSVNVAFDWDEEDGRVGIAYGSLRPAKDVPAVDALCEKGAIA